MQLFSVSGTLAGVSLTIASLFNIMNKARALASIADDIFTVCAFLFISCNFLIFWTLRVNKRGESLRLSAMIDIIFWLAQILMLFAGAIIVWTTL